MPKPAPIASGPGTTSKPVLVITLALNILSEKNIDVALMPIGAYNPWSHAHCNPEEALKIAAKYKHWICDDKMMSIAAKDSKYMHCLPADRGNEVIDAVIDGPHSVIYREAENRLHTCKAVMALTMGGYKS